MLLLITLTGPVVVAPPIEFSSDSRSAHSDIAAVCGYTLIKISYY